ncbi:MAG: hypothetical protein OEN48_16105 [Betaproteobacteria bacterium]|nr:hypothetical protein [Gammaproteobacteria bacterium]MDH3438496.1 hypothetical protein [Betaproteobacteria bacterium]
MEFLLVKGRAQAGFEVLKDVEFPWRVAKTALQHYEQLESSSYPRGLKGEDILPAARILR